MRHAPDGSEISLSLVKTGTETRLVIADNGPGIPFDERDNVVKRLYRLDRSRNTPGNGLGLSLVQAIAGLHGAELSLEDNAPGLRVVIRFRS